VNWYAPIEKSPSTSACLDLDNPSRIERANKSDQSF